MLTDAGAIASLVEDIKSALSGFDNGAFASHAERARLLAAAERLIIAAREPEEYLYFTATQVRSSKLERINPLAVLFLRILICCDRLHRMRPLGAQLG